MQKRKSAPATEKPNGGAVLKAKKPKSVFNLATWTNELVEAILDNNMSAITMLGCESPANKAVLAKLNNLDMLLASANEGQNVMELLQLLELTGMPELDDSVIMMAADAMSSELVSSLDISGAQPFIAKHSINLSEPSTDERFDGYSPMGAAAIVGSLPLLQLLVSVKGDITAADKLNRTPAIIAAGAGNLDVLEYLCEAAGDTSILLQSVGGASPFTAALEAGQYATTMQLLELKADPKVVDNDGCSALVYAVRGGNVLCVQALIKQGADVNQRDVLGRTPLHHCALAVDEEELAAPPAPADPNDTSILAHAGGAAKGDSCVAVAIYLIDCVAEINALDGEGFTPAMRAAAVGNLPVLECLHSLKADLNIEVTDAEGAKCNALVLAAKENHIPVVEFLVEIAEKVNMKHVLRAAKIVRDNVLAAEEQEEP